MERVGSGFNPVDDFAVLDVAYQVSSVSGVNAFDPGSSSVPVSAPFGSSLLGLGLIGMLWIRKLKMRTEDIRD